jgi:hypothetical protein
MALQRTGSRVPLVAGLSVIGFFVASCGPTGRASPLPGVQAQPQPGGCQVQLFQGQVPIRPFTRLGSVGAHNRSGYFTSVSKESLYNEIRAQACSLGGDGIIEIVETENRRFEWNELDVSGTAIRFGN